MLTGLSNDEVVNSRNLHGSNVFNLKEERTFLHTIKDVVLEPMFILLLVACTIYFLLKQFEEGIKILLRADIAWSQIITAFASFNLWEA